MEVYNQAANMLAEVAGTERGILPSVVQQSRPELQDQMNSLRSH